jgi:hypothetical protein
MLAPSFHGKSGPMPASRKSDIWFMNFPRPTAQLYTEIGRFLLSEEFPIGLLAQRTTTLGSIDEFLPGKNNKQLPC